MYKDVASLCYTSETIQHCMLIVWKINMYMHTYIQTYTHKENQTLKKKMCHLWESLKACITKTIAQVVFQNIQIILLLAIFSLNS